MYTFILTPSIIQNIRNYNANNSYTSYIGSLDGAGEFGYKCGNGSGKTCISDYLSYLINLTGAKEQPGTCVNDQYRTYNDNASFEKCRY